MTYALESNQAARLRRPDSDGVSFYLGNAHTWTERTRLQTGAEARLVFSAQHNNVGNVKVRPTLGKEGETVSGSIFLDTVPRGYGLRLRTSREEDKAKPDDYK